MNTIERLRPEVRPLDAVWSADTLESILSNHGPAPARRSRRGRRLALVGAMAAGVVGFGGIAYAAGVVPALITDHFDQTSSTKLSDVHKVASFTSAKNGTARTFEIWRGTDTDGRSCTAVLEANGHFGPDFSGHCGDYPTDAWFNTTNEAWRGSINDTPPPTTYYVYGEPTLPGVTSVRVVGDGFERSVAIDARTGGYAVAIPELDRGVRGHFATVQFVDATGTVVGTSELSEK